jgi:hypothetical protein
MDVHNHVDPNKLTPEAAAEAHKMDLAVQDRFGVRFLTYWYDPATGKVFCLSDAPNKEAVNAVHGASHGVLADDIFEVTEGG